MLTWNSESISWIARAPSLCARTVYIVEGVEQWRCVVLPSLRQARPGLSFALDGPREIKHFGVSLLMETEQNQEEQRSRNALRKRRTKDDLVGRYRQRHIRTNEHGRVLCSLRRREIGMAVNLRDKSFTNFDHGKSTISGEKSRLGCARFKNKELGVRIYYRGRDNGSI